MRVINRGDWWCWMEWDRMQQEVRGKVRPMATAEMNDRWGKSRGGMDDIVTVALKKCRNHMKQP